MLLAPGRRPARCPGGPPAGRVDLVRGAWRASPAVGSLAAAELGAQGVHRRGGWIWCAAPDGPVPASGSEVAETQLTGERGFRIGSASGGGMDLVRDLPARPVSAVESQLSTDSVLTGSGDCC